MPFYSGDDAPAKEGVFDTLMIIEKIHFPHK